MNNEPVAWMQIHYKDKMCVTKLSPVKTWEDDVPLYTHPHSEESVKVKELTDEEINKLWAESHEDNIAMQQGFTTQQHYFAHLILRKASEK